MVTDGHTNGRTDIQTDGHTFLWKCEVPSKNVNNFLYHFSAASDQNPTPALCLICNKESFLPNQIFKKLINDKKNPLMKMKAFEATLSI